VSPLRIVFGAALISLAAAFSTMAAQPDDRGPTPGLGWGPGGSKAVGAPAPVAGAGLPVLAAVGGYIWYVRRRRRGR
jgi:hypothetical protein